jgi:hypothetical protein
MAFREIENLIPMKEPADKTSMFRTLLKGQALSYFEHHLMRRLEAEDSEVPYNELIELVLRDQDEIIEILDQAKAPEWHEAMLNENIDIFEMSYEESVSYFKRLENLEKIRHTNGPNPSSLPVDNKKTVSVTSIVCKSFKNHKGSNMWCHYCDKSNHNTADCRAISGNSTYC